MNALKMLLGSFVVISCFWFAEANGQATDVECDGCVDASDLAVGSVGRRELKKYSVSTQELGPQAVTSNKIKDGTVTTVKLRDGAVTGDKIAASAVGVTQVDPNQVQLRVGGSCAVGKYITAINEDGSVVCEAGEVSGDDLLQIVSQLQSIDRAINDLGQAFGVCSVRNLFACDQQNPLFGQIDLWILNGYPSWKVFNVGDPLSGLQVYALPFSRTISDIPSNELVGLVFGGGANFITGHWSLFGYGEVLVDSCDSPTVQLVPAGTKPSNSLGLDNGSFYRIVSDASPEALDVTGGSYGLIHDFSRGFPLNWSNHDDPPPLCSMVNDREGTYDAYAIYQYGDTSAWGNWFKLTPDAP